MLLLLMLLFELRPLNRILHSKSYFDIRIGHEYRILTFKLRPNIVFSHSNFYIDIRTEAEYRILTFMIQL